MQKNFTEKLFSSVIFKEYFKKVKVGMYGLNETLDK